METIVIELLLWAGLLVFFWAMRDSLAEIEDDPDQQRRVHPRDNDPAAVEFDEPETLLDAIGSYLDRPIYRYAIIGGKYYQFIHILTGASLVDHDERERLVAPGLVYAPCQDTPRLS